ncbi:MAG: cell division protein FtsZ [bacterium]
MNAKIKIIGIGGAGCIAVDYMMKRGLTSAECIAINTDQQALDHCGIAHKILIGKNLTRGLGAGANPEIGKKAVDENKEEIKEAVKGSNMVLITAGMGGGTGTGGAAVIASIAKNEGALVVGIFTTPYKFEGEKRTMQAEAAIEDLRKFVDCLIVIPNEKLLNAQDKNTSLQSAFELTNEAVYEVAAGIVETITIPGIVNVDFADVQSILTGCGEALVGSGTASGFDRAVEAAKKAISSPMFENRRIFGAKNILINISGSSSLTLEEIDAGNQVIYDEVGANSDFIFGVVNKEEMNDAVTYTVIASGLGAETNYKHSNFSPKKENRLKKSKLIFNEPDFNDADIPAVIRNGVSYKIIANDKEEDDNVSFQLDSAEDFNFLSNLYRTYMKSKTIRKKENNEEDSNRFLRKIMEPTDNVNCTVFSPDKISFGSRMLVQVFIHKEEDTKEAEKVATEFDENTTRRGFTSLETEIEYGAKLLLNLQMKDVHIDDAVQTFTWRGRTGSVAFAVTVPQELHANNLFGKVIISNESVPIGHITFIIKLLPTITSESEIKDIKPTGNATNYKYAFISYAAKDREEVLRRVQMLAPLKINFFQDILTLDPGDRWEKEIYQYIDKADVFFLFWSSAARESEWVSKEIRYALQRKQGRDDFPPEILPIIIEGPPVPETPAELKHIQFNDRVIYFMNK